ncbi:GTP-binding protein [Actinosynnema sp. NPDC050436]|uniref:GTP-binding protein n=1 Tax=Actinosynnema sp. NPDC050436 TaxID=3155659 RepID=UPI0033D0E6A2
MTGRLVDEVRSLLRAAVDAHRDDPDTAELLRRRLDRMDGPLRVALAGKAEAGKSTLLDALAGEEVTPTGTRVVTHRHGPTPGVAGSPAVDRPARDLPDVTLTDTPDVSATRIPAAEDEADAVLYLMRHLHSADLRLLASFHDRGVARATPVHTVAVLSRADEVGAGRIDALMSARRVARRHRADPRLRGLCQTVVPVAGLIARTARTLRHDEYTALAALAAAPRAEAESAMLSVDRFTRAGPDHAGLLARFGLFGVRLSLGLIRQGFADPVRLAAELRRRSGLDELRGTLSVLFGERRDLLKARSALLAVDAVLRDQAAPHTVPLLTEVERVLADAHEFAELRTIGVLRSGAVAFPAGAGEEAERLLGGAGAGVWTRLAVPADTARRDQRAAAWAALGRWQRWAENPLSSRDFVDVARVVVRSCEGLVDQLDD